MKSDNKAIYRVLTSLLVILMISGCNGLPDNLVREVELMAYAQKQHQGFIKREEKALQDLDSHQQSVFLQPYASKENWAQFFIKATEQLNLAEQLYRSKIRPVFDEDDQKSAAALRILIKQFKQQLADSKKSASHTSERIAFLIKTRDSAPAVYQQATQALLKLKTIQEQFNNKAHQAIADYKNKSDDINQRITGLKTIVDAGELAGDLLNQQYSQADSRDYAIFGDAAENITGILKNAKSYFFKNSSKLDELYKSYVKVLADQQVEYYIVIRRASWCNGEYCNEGSTRSYSAVKVDGKVFEYFDQLNVNTIATLRQSWGSQTFKSAIKDDMWRALGISRSSNWQRGHTEADYWVDKMYVKAYHKYVEVNNNEMSETGWVNVDEALYWKQYENLGMAILTKPYGFYEEDSLTDAQPVGMATIAEPVMKDGVATGSNQYGEWRQSNGHSFWFYYGMYRIFGDLTGPSRYGYNDWNGYRGRRNGFGYYGHNNRYGTFGASTYSNNRYRNSQFAIRNTDAVNSAHTGRKTSGTASVRGASSSSRNRGPSSRGK